MIKGLIQQFRSRRARARLERLMLIHSGDTEDVLKHHQEEVVNLLKAMYPQAQEEQTECEVCSCTRLY
jgi:hypothetical protein